MKLADQQRAELKALADAATPGPWRIGSLESYDGYSGKPYRNVWQGQGEDARTIARAILDQGNEQTDVDADAMFIAAAREAVPAMLADLEEAGAAESALLVQTVELDCVKAELAATRQLLEQYKRDADDWGGALNDASWKLVETFPGGMTGHQFNNCKAALRAAIQAYFESIDAALSAKEKSNEV